MDFETLLSTVGSEPVFETGFLLAGDVNPQNIRRQLSRWTKTGKIVQLRRGLYALARPYRKTEPHPYLVANRLMMGSYVSLQSALAYYGMIPEHVPVTTSVTTGRPKTYETPMGIYTYRHIRRGLFYGHRFLDVGQGQHAYVACPEKALLDLVHLAPGGDAESYLRGLRLQALGQLDLDELLGQADKSGSPKIRRAAERVVQLAAEEKADYEVLSS